MAHIDWLDELVGPADDGAEYGYLGGAPGALVRLDPTGDTLIDGERVTVLEEVWSRDEALEAARQWRAQGAGS